MSSRTVDTGTDTRHSPALAFTTAASTIAPLSDAPPLLLVTNSPALKTLELVLSSAPTLLSPLTSPAGTLPPSTSKYTRVFVPDAAPPPFSNSTTLISSSQPVPGPTPRTLGTLTNRSSPKFTLFR